MGLLTQTILIFALMAGVCALPFLFQRLRTVSSLLFLLGTGSLAGIIIFDLFPEIVHMGGRQSVMLVAGVSVSYALVHLLHLRYHQTPCEHRHDPSAHATNSFPVFFTSIAGHCFAGGMLLAISQRLQPRLAAAVFLAMLAHKAYEALVFASIVVGLEQARSRKIVLTAIYCLALPAGVAVEQMADGALSQTAAIYISSIAVGSLLGCLVFDFIIPSLRHLKRRWIRLAWIAAGLLLTRLIVR